MSNKIPQVDLTTHNMGPNGLPKTAIYLPALSAFYSSLLGKYAEPGGFDPARMPAGFENGLAGLNWLDKENGYFYYKWLLYSAGHANIDITVDDPKEAMIRKRDRKTTFVLGDSGGFQIGKGVWEGNWTDINCPKAKKKREQVLSWLDAYMDYGMVLDIPVWAYKTPAAKKIGVYSYQDAVDATIINNDYFINNRSGECKLLNVLQGENHTESDMWYNSMKSYSDPTVYPKTHFNGWAMGGQNVTDTELLLTRIVDIVYDGLLQEGKHDWIHFLGIGKLPWGCFLTDLQNSLRKYHNPSVSISMDAASPFLTVANGGIYLTSIIEDRKKWGVVPDRSVDDKKYSSDTRPFKEVLLEAKPKYKKFDDSPITARLQGRDICFYKPGVLNKKGKEGKTSWDLLSYLLQMGHNVFNHIDAVQTAIRRYTTENIYPPQLIEVRNEKIEGRVMLDQIFAAKTKAEAMKIIEEVPEFWWWKLTGSRGNKGKAARNSHTKFEELFTGAEVPVVDDVDSEVEPSEYDGAVATKLDSLEESV